MAMRIRRQHLRNMKCTVHDLEVMDVKPSRVELWVHSNLSRACLCQNIYCEV